MGCREKEREEKEREERVQRQCAQGKASVAMEGAARYSGINIRISEGHGQDWGPGMVMGARVTFLSRVPTSLQ